MIAYFPTSPTISPSLSLSLNTRTQRFLRSLSPPFIWQSVTPPPPAADGLLILLSESTLTHSFTTSLLLSHTLVYETFPAVCSKVDIPRAAQISGTFEQFEHSVEEKEDQPALRYEVCLNEPLRRVFSSWHRKLLKFCTSTMSLKKRKPSMVFSWHKSFAILAPWRKGKLCDSICDLMLWMHEVTQSAPCNTWIFSTGSNLSGWGVGGYLETCNLNSELLSAWFNMVSVIFKETDEFHR